MTMSFKSRWPLASAMLLGLGSSWVLPSDELLGPGAVYAQSWPGFLKRDKADATKKPAAASKMQPDSTALKSEKTEPEVRLNFSAQTWDSVLKKVAEDCGSTLVMDQVPKGRFTRTEIKKHSRAEALRILNQELETQDFRVIEQGNFLVVMYLPDARPDYRRAQIGPAASDVAQKTSQGTPVSGRARVSNGVQQASEQRPTQSSQRRDSGIRTANFQNDEPSAANNPAAIKNYKPQKKTSRELSGMLFDVFRERAEVLENSIEGLPGLRIYSSQPAGMNGQKKVLFTLGVDVGNNELFVEGSGEQADRIVRLLQKLDSAPKQEDEATKLISTKKGPTAVAKNVQAAIARLVSQNDGQAPEAKTETNRKDEDGKPLPDTVAGVRSDVNVEAMEDLGILILKGNQADVDAVLAIIKQIEELSATTAPDVHLRVLKNVDGVALAELLTTVYDKLKEAQGKKSDQNGTVSVIGVVRPNAVIVLASERDLDSVLELIDQLDKPVPAQAGFAVFPLEYAIASQVEVMLTDFYTKSGNITERGGLGTKIRIVADVRTNQVIVFAQANDLREISKVIAKLDRNESGAVSQVQFFNLKHAVADDMAQTLNLIFQSVLNPAQLGQGQLGQQALGIGGGNSSAQLKEVRSSILEYLGTGAEQKKYRSGILADIRVTGDNRSNTLVVTAPRESMDLIASLVERLDRQTLNSAEIKHFSLRNADSSSVVTLLNQLFNAQQTQGGGGQGGGQNNQNNQQPGIQLAAAQDAPSVVPLRFSADVRTNSVVAIGTAEALGVVEALMLRLDESEVRERKTKVFRLKNTDSPVIAQAIQQFLTSQVTLLQQQGGGNQQNGGLVSSFELIEKQIIVQSETSTNSVLISASPRYFDEIVQMVESLDEDLPQVVIQALLVEVTLNNTDEFGIELGIQDPILFNRGTVGTTLNPGFPFNSTGPLGNSISTAGSRPDILAGQGLSNLNVGRSNGDLGFGGLVLSAGSDSVNILLRALSENRRVEVLSRPQIRTLHNKPGFISVSSDVPRPTASNLTTTGLSQQNFEYVPAGVTLDVLPKIGSDGKIQLNMRAKKTTLVPGGIAVAGTTVPLIDGTTAEAVITVSDNQTAVVGGLISRTDRNTTRKIPWLGDLPVLGHAFRYELVAHERKELIIFLTPRVVRNDDDNETIKAIETSRLHWTECKAEEVHGPIFGMPAIWNDAPENAAPLVEPSRFNGLTPVDPPKDTPAPPAPNDAPMTRRNRDSGIRQVTHQEPARTTTKPTQQPRKREGE